MGRRGAVVAAGLLAILGVVVVRGAVPAAREAHERAASTATAPTATASTTAPATTAPPNTVAAAPTTVPSAPPPADAPPGTIPSDIQVAGVAVTRAPEPETTPSAPPPCPAPGGADFVGAPVNDHRSIRCQQGVGGVALGPGGSGHAQYHAERLMAAGACSSLFHSTELPQWYSTSYWGENIACVAWSRGCSSDADYIVNGWMNSDEHRPNILDPHFQWMGVGVACDG